MRKYEKSFLKLGNFDNFLDKTMGVRKMAYIYMALDHLHGRENVDIIQQYVLRTLPGIGPLWMQEMVVPIRSLHVTRRQQMKRMVEVVL